MAYPVYTQFLGARIPSACLNLRGMRKRKPDLEDRNPRQPASIYRLQIAGILLDGWEDRLGYFRVVHEEGPGPQTRTTLMGAVQDQSDLLGVLTTLHELRLPLLLVEAMDLESMFCQVSGSRQPTKEREP